MSTVHAQPGDVEPGRLPAWAVVRRHPVLFVFVVAFAARLVLAVLINQVSGGALFEDDGTYTLLAEQAATGRTERWTAYEYWLFDATGTLLVPLTWLFTVFGPSALLGQVVVITFGSIAAGAVARVALEGLSVGWAVTAGLVVALLPSQVLFSSVVLKDAPVWAVLALLALTVSVAGRARGRRLLLALLCLTVLYVLLAHLRVHTLIAACWAASIATAFTPGPERLRRTSGVLLISVVVPMLYGLGPAGLRLATDATATLEERRTNNAVGASTAFVPAPKPPAAPSRPAPSSEPKGDGGAEAAPWPAPADPPASSLSALPRGLSVMLFEPYPTRATLSNSRVSLALAENLVWWPLLALAAFSAVGLSRHRRVLAFPWLVSGAIVLLYALSEGNFGTAYRHRGEVVWAVALLAAFGACELQSMRKRRSTT